MENRSKLIAGIISLVGGLVVGVFIAKNVIAAPSYIATPLPIDENYHVVSGMYVYTGGSWIPLSASADGYLNVNATVSGTAYQNIWITSGSVYTTDYNYVNKVTSGCSGGKITGVTSQTLTITDKVVRFSFKYSNDSNPSQFGEIASSIYNTGTNYVKDGDVYGNPMPIPQAVTFTLSNLATNATVQYDILTVK